MLLLAVVLAVDQRASHMREDLKEPSALSGAVVLPSGAIALELPDPAVQTKALEVEDPPVDAPPVDAPAPPPVPAPAPTLEPTPQPTSLSNAKDKIDKLDPEIVEPKDLYPPSPWVPPADKKNFAANLPLPPSLHESKPTPTLDEGPAHAARMAEELAYNVSHEAEVDASLLAQRLQDEAKAEADRLRNLTVLEAASAVVGVLATEPLRVLSDMEAFLLDLKRALVGPPMHVMRDEDLGTDPALASVAIKKAMEHMEMQDGKQLTEIAVQKPTGETEYVVSVNGIMEYRPPTAHGAVRVVSVLLLLASAIVLGIGWRYGSAPGMYPYVEDCRL